jgi:hypothetical protein
MPPVLAITLLLLHVFLVAVVSALPVRGAVIFLTDGTPRRVEELSRAISSLDAMFNDRYGYPVVIFYSLENDQRSPLLSAAQQDALRSTSRSTLLFAEVNFTEYMTAPGAQGAPALILGKSMGYRHMCRFFAGPVAHHPALASFDYYWRLDTDSMLSERMRYDVFSQLPCHGWRYTYAQTACDDSSVTFGLWKVVATHHALAKGGSDLAARLPPLLTEHGTCPHSEGPEAQGVAWNNIIYYNNWEVVDLSWLRSAEYAAFFAAIDATGGIYTKRWGDAPVRTLAAVALLPPAAIHRFEYVRFRHDMEWGRSLPWWGLNATAFPEEAGADCVNHAAHHRYFEAPRRNYVWDGLTGMALGGSAILLVLCSRCRRTPIASSISVNRWCLGGFSGWARRSGCQWGWRKTAAHSLN